MTRRYISYSKAELAWLKANCTHSRKQAHRQFVERFDRSEVSFDNIKSLFTRKGWKTGRTGYFPSAHVPANKGKKMPFNANTARTQFKKGHERMTR